MVPVRNHQGPGRVIRLAPGAVLSGAKPCSAMLLELTVGKVHLNQHAVAILDLCDGSRSRERVLREALQRSAAGMRAADVLEFLDAAQARGWIIESE